MREDGMDGATDCAAFDETVVFLRYTPTH
jgi:hypothetical protein